LVEIRGVLIWWEGDEEGVGVDDPPKDDLCFFLSSLS
jgi:hypothetical protein